MILINLFVTATATAEIYTTIYSLFAINPPWATGQHNIQVLLQVVSTHAQVNFSPSSFSFLTYCNPISIRPPSPAITTRPFHEMGCHTHKIIINMTHLNYYRDIVLHVFHLYVFTDVNTNYCYNHKCNRTQKPPNYSKTPMQHNSDGARILENRSPQLVSQVFTQQIKTGSSETNLGETQSY